MQSFHPFSSPSWSSHPSSPLSHPSTVSSTVPPDVPTSIGHPASSSLSTPHTASTPLPLNTPLSQTVEKVGCWRRGYSMENVTRTTTKENFDCQDWILIGNTLDDNTQKGLCGGQCTHQKLGIVSMLIMLLLLLFFPIFVRWLFLKLRLFSVLCIS